MSQNQYPPGGPGQYPPQYPQQGYGQQPQYQQSQQPPYQQAGGYPAQPPMAPPPNQMQQGLPTIVPPTQQALDEARDRARELAEARARARSGGGGKTKYFQFMGPNGSKFKEAYVTYRSVIGIYFAHGWTPGGNNFQEVSRHFAFANGQAVSGYCPDHGPKEKRQKCFMCEAHQLALDSGRKEAVGKARTVFKYQGYPFWYDESQNLMVPDPQQCMMEDGSMRPLILDAGSTLHGRIQDIVRDRGWAACFDANFGRVFKVEKIKTGNDKTDVEYSAIDREQMPLPECFWPAANALYDFDQMFAPMTVEKQREFIVGAGLPMPPELGGTGAQSYQVAPNAPWDNPYQDGNGQAQSPQGQYGAPSQASQLPPQAPYSAPPSMVPPPGSAPTPPPYQPPPAMSAPSGAPFVAPTMAPPPPIPAPTVNPAIANQYGPPASYAPSAPPPPSNAATQAAPQSAPPRTPVPPGEQPAPSPTRTPTPSNGQAQSEPVMAQQGQSLVSPLNVLLPDGRHRCFSRYAGEGDRFCQTCPDWIKTQCQAQSQSLDSSPAAEAALTAEQAQQRLNDEDIPF